MKDLEEYVKQIEENIIHDRAKANSLLDKLMAYLFQDATRNEKLGLVAAKYLETLQRSNEQLVKITDMIRKNHISEGEPSNLDGDDLDDLFDKIQEENSNEK